MSQEARLEIKIWTDKRRKLPKDIPAALWPHLNHVSEKLSEGYLAGEIIEEGDERGRGAFSGWWEIRSEA